MQQQQQPIRFTHQERMAILVWVALQMARAHQAAMLPFMRHSFGPRFFHPYGFTALIFLQPIAAASAEGRLYLWAWLVALFGQRIWTFRIWWKGNKRLPSSFEGIPYLGLQMPLVRTVEKARQTEPIICLFGGMLVATISPSLGFFIMAGFISMNLNLGIEWWIRYRERQTIIDAEYEMSSTANYFRR